MSDPVQPDMSKDSLPMAVLLGAGIGVFRCALLQVIAFTDSNHMVARYRSPASHHLCFSGKN